MFNSKEYKIIYVQKSSPSKSDDFVLAEIYKFFSVDKDGKNDFKYIIRAELHKHNVFAVKFYAARDRKLESKYSRLTNRRDAAKVIITCASVLPLLLEKYSNASFAFNSSRTIDIHSDKIEGPLNNQRFRIYRHVTDGMVGRNTFEHYEFPEISSYLLVNRKSCSNPDKSKETIRDMFVDTYAFTTQI